MKIKDLVIWHTAMTLERFKGNKMAAARDMGISVRSLRDWVKNEKKLAKYRKKPLKRGRK